MSITPEFQAEPNYEPVFAISPTLDSSSSEDPWMGELHALLQELESLAAAEQTLPPVFGAEVDNQLVQVRLGMASSLFAALQCKHAATAGHSLRVALTCSAWSLQMGFPPRQRDVIEVAALLHDIGVIGGAGQHSAETRQSRRGRGGLDEPRPPRRRGNPQAQLHLARSNVDCRARLGVVRRPIARVCLAGGADPARRG